METPKSFPGVFGVFSKSMILVGSLYCLIGLTGYLRYGDDVGASVTFNLDEADVYVKRVTLRTGKTVVNGFARNCPAEWPAYAESSSRVPCTYRTACRGT